MTQLPPQLAHLGDELERATTADLAATRCARDRAATPAGLAQARTRDRRPRDRRSRCRDRREPAHQHE